MKRSDPYPLVVLHKQTITPHMLRITLGGEGMLRFPADQASAYIKLLFPVAGQARPVMRTYTIRAQNEASIDVDFAIHGEGEGGLACQWAHDCQPGDAIDIAGPGPKKQIDPNCDTFLMVGDMTALPAISVNLEQLPDGLRGHVIVEVNSDADRQPLTVPDGVSLTWVINAHPGECTPLVDAVKALDWPEGKVTVWTACEFNSMRALRRYFREARGITRDDMYISSYWIKGSDEITHKKIKREDAEQINNTPDLLAVAVEGR